MYSENQEKRTPKRVPVISAEEAKFIDENAQFPIFASGMLAQIRRTGQTLEETYERAISEPGNEEHIPAVQKARDFLAENSEKFGLIIPPNEST